MKITLASHSDIRKRLLTSAGVIFDAVTSPFDEEAVKEDLISKGKSPRDISMALAKGKANAVAQTEPGLVVGCDQALDFEGRLMSKPRDLGDARDQLKALRGQQHQLFSAAAIYETQTCVWTSVKTVTLTMHEFSDAYLDSYLTRNWDSVRTSVGGYKLEEEGVRLFSDIDGDYFTVLGMPLVEVLQYLRQRGAIET